jgi:hypothetical protein
MRGCEGSSKSGQDLMMPSNIKQSYPKAATNAHRGSLASKSQQNDSLFMILDTLE